MWALPRQRTPLADITAPRMAAVTCHFNPAGYRRPRDNYFRFRAALRGVRLFTVEVSFDGEFHLPSDWQIRADERHLMWQKESLLNAAIARLPAEFDQVAWIDADLLFLNPDWASQTSALLDVFPAVQLFEVVHYTTASGRLDGRFPSFVHSRQKQLAGHAAPGGAWAARRDLIENHGLYPYQIAGGGDQMFVDAIFGARNQFFESLNPHQLLAHSRGWHRAIYADVGGRVGCTPGDVVHLYHGTRSNRQYIERHRVLREQGYDPSLDVRVTQCGLLEWATHKPRLHAGLREYFAQRREDD